MKTREAEPPPRPSLPGWLFRACAVLGIPGLLLLGLETGLRLAGVGHPAAFLIPDEKPGYVRTNPDFAGFFLPANFDLQPLVYRLPARKPPDTIRVVLLGESAAQGVPEPEFGMAAQLRAQLRARYPEKNIEVINTGIVAINSHVVDRIARDLAGYAPDLFVVYMGNNEVVGPYGPGCAYLAASPPLWLIRLSVFVRSTRCGQLLARVLGRLQAGGRPPVEWGGMSMFVNNAVSGDDPRLETVYRNFGENLRDIVRVGTGAGAKVLLCTVVSNLKDCAPLLSLHRPGLGPAELAAWRQAFDRGKLAWLLGEAAARDDLAAARRLDPQYAETAFMLGKLELERGDVAAAREDLVAAEHGDALRFRPDPRINAIIRAVARDGGPGVSLLDAAVELGSDPASTVGPAGREILLEHVHFRWEGNYRLARLMAADAGRALTGRPSPPDAGLDAAGCARALGLTVRGRQQILEKAEAIMRKPPFTDQLTYAEDQATFEREIARAAAAARDPAALRRDREDVLVAIKADPDNPALCAVAGDLDEALGDTAGALEQARREAELLPANPVNTAKVASLLSRLGRNEEAEALLEAGARRLGNPEVLTPSRAAVYARMKRFDLSRACLQAAISRHPGEARYHQVLGNIERLAGDPAAAEREYRTVLTLAPGSEEGLEALVSLLGDQHRTGRIEEASLAAAPRQGKNQANNLRVAEIHEARGEAAAAAAFLAAAQQSGPGTAAIELRIARMLYRLGRTDEMMLHLARARRLSVIEEDPESTGSIDQLISRLRPDRPE